MTASGEGAKPLRIAIAGLGAIGLKVAEAIDAGVPGCELVAIGVRDHAKATAHTRHFRHPVTLTDIAALEPLADLVVECAPAAILPQVVTPFLCAGKRVMVLSVGGLLSRLDLVDLARAHHGRIFVPSGALLGLDAVAAAAEGTIHSVTMVTRKPVKGLLGAPHLVANHIEIEQITEPTLVFSGTARDAAIGFPANLNVVAALSLAGIGPDRTRVEVWADPAAERNIHRIEVDADSARFSMTIENLPSENPKTSRITALSVLASLRKLGAPLAVGG